MATARSLPSAATTRCSAFTRRKNYSHNSRAIFYCIKGVNELCRRYPTVSCLPGFLMLNDTTTAEFSVLFAACFCIRLSLRYRWETALTHSVSNQTLMRHHTFSVHLAVQRKQLEVKLGQAHFIIFKVWKSPIFRSLEQSQSCKELCWLISVEGTELLICLKQRSKACTVTNFYHLITATWQKHSRGWPSRWDKHAYLGEQLALFSFIRNLF